MTTPNTFDLSGKIAIVTGASRGIGESAAKLLAASPQPATKSLLIDSPATVGRLCGVTGRSSDPEWLRSTVFVTPQPKHS